MNQHPTRNLSLFALAAVLLGQSLVAQRAYAQDEMKANFAEMKTHSWFTDGGWTTDFDVAKARAKATGKPIFAYFTRTYSP